MFPDPQKPRVGRITAKRGSLLPPTADLSLAPSEGQLEASPPVFREISQTGDANPKEAHSEAPWWDCSL